MAGMTESIRDKPGVGRTHSSFGGRRSCSLHLSHRPGRLEQRGGGSILRGVVALAVVLCCAVAGWGQTAAPWALSTPFSSPTPALAFPLHASLLFSQMLSGPQSYRGKPTNGPGRPAAGSLFQRPCPDPML